MKRELNTVQAIGIVVVVACLIGAIIFGTVLKVTASGVDCGTVAKPRSFDGGSTVDAVATKVCDDARDTRIVWVAVLVAGVVLGGAAVVAGRTRADRVEEPVAA